MAKLASREAYIKELLKLMSLAHDPFSGAKVDPNRIVGHERPADLELKGSPASDAHSLKSAASLKAARDQEADETIDYLRSAYSTQQPSHANRRRGLSRKRSAANRSLQQVGEPDPIEGVVGHQRNPSSQKRFKASQCTAGELDESRTAEPGQS